MLLLMSVHVKQSQGPEQSMSRLSMASGATGLPIMIVDVQPIDLESSVAEELWSAPQGIPVQVACIVIDNELGSWRAQQRLMCMSVK